MLERILSVLYGKKEREVYNLPQDENPGDCTPLAMTRDGHFLPGEVIEFDEAVTAPVFAGKEGGINPYQELILGNDCFGMDCAKYDELLEEVRLESQRVNEFIQEQYTDNEVDNDGLPRIFNLGEWLQEFNRAGQGATAGCTECGQDAPPLPRHASEGRALLTLGYDRELGQQIVELVLEVDVQGITYGSAVQTLEPVTISTETLDLVAELARRLVTRVLGG